MSSNLKKQTKAEVVKQNILDAKKESHEFTIPLMEGLSDILSASATIMITDQEVLVGQINFSGEACLNVVYSMENGEISNYKFCEKFSSKIENIAFNPNTLVKILPNVISVKIEKEERNNLIRAKLELEYEINTIQNQDLLILENNESDIFVKENIIEISRHISRNCSDFNQTIVFDTKLPIKNILNITSTAIITKADTLDGMIIFEGEISTRVLYSSEDDRPVLVSLTSRDSFREEIEDPKSTSNSMIEAFARVLCRDIEANINKEDKTISTNIPVRLNYDLFESSPVKVIVDAYSTKNEINLTTEAFFSNSISGYDFVENKIDGNITLDEKSLRIDKILGIDGGFLSVNNKSFNDGELFVEGFIHLNIIYLNDEQENINSSSIEVPFNFKEKLGDSPVDIKIENNLIDLDAVVKRGREIYVDGKIRTAIWINKEVQNAIINSIDNGEPLPARDGSIEIYFASQGETFWDVAKDLKIPEETLKSQNSTIAEPFENAEKLVYFEQKTLPIV